MTVETVLRPRAEFTFSAKQGLALRTVMSADVDTLLYGGAKGGGKTVFGTVFCYAYAKTLIKLFGLKPSAYPVEVGFMGRKQGSDFTATTLNTWKRNIPPDAYTLRAHDKLITIEDTVALRYGGLDDTKTVKKFNSAEYAFFFIDQAEEVSEEDVSMLQGTLRLKLNGRSPAYKALLTANPAICWLKRAFITAPAARNKFVQALPTDNPFLDPGYVDRLRRAFAFNEALLRAYLEGSWDDLDAAFAVIKASDIRKCVNSGYRDPKGIKKVTVADIAENGDDETCIGDWEGPCLDRKSAEYYTHRDLMDTCGRIQAHVTKHGSNLVCVDKIGVGAGVYSRLCEVYSGNKGVTVYGFDGRIKPPQGIHGETYQNYKSYAWFRTAEKAHEGHLDIPDDETMKSQLGSVTYHFTSGEVMMVDAKDQLKKKLGRSPDRADMVVMALDALDRAPYIKRRDAYAATRTRSYNPATV